MAAKLASLHGPPGTVCNDSDRLPKGEIEKEMVWLLYTYGPAACLGPCRGRKEGRSVVCFGPCRGRKEGKGVVCLGVPGEGKKMGWGEE